LGLAKVFNTINPGKKIRILSRTQNRQFLTGFFIVLKFRFLDPFNVKYRQLTTKKRSNKLKLLIKERSNANRN
jgi:hypothetical protein